MALKSDSATCLVHVTAEDDAYIITLEDLREYGQDWACRLTVRPAASPMHETG